jgi:zinc protease
MNASLFSESAANDLIEQLYQVPVERLVLSNGLTCVHRPDFSSEVVSVQVWVKTGSIHEDRLIGSGLSHFLEHMLFKGTERRDGKSISREVHAMGGGINAYTTFDRTVYYIDAPSTAFEQVVDVLSDLVLHSTLPEAEVLRERDVILREIDMGLDDPDCQLSQALFRTAFQRHPYREPVIGHRELFEQVSREELYAYYKSRYVPNNMVVSVAGAVHPDTVKQVVEASFGAIPRGRLAPVQVEQEPVQLAARREDIVGSYNVFRGGMGFKVPHMSHPDSPRLDALAHALGGSESSLLWQRLRNEANLVSYIDCRSWSPGAAGLFWISYVCDPDKASEVEVAILQLLESVKLEGLDASVVDKARRQALSSEINGRKTMSGQASRLGVGEVVVGDLLYGRRYLKRLQAIQPGDLQVVAERYLVEEGKSSVTLGPELKSLSDRALQEVLSPEAFQSVEYVNGGRLLYQLDRKLPKVHLRCVLRGGPMYEAANQRGISQLLVELLTLDTQSRTAADISHLVDGIGGSFSATGGNNTISLALEVLPGDLPIALDLLDEALTQPIFAKATFETERDSQVSDLMESDDEILDFGFRKLRERFFETHPFAVSADGRVEDLEALEVKDVQAQYAKLVRAPNVVLSVCGNFDLAVLETRAKHLFENLLASEALETIDAVAEGAPSAAVDAVEVMDREQAVVLQGYPDVGLLDDEYVVGEVLNELFSGMSSQLFERVREDKGMAYYVGSSRVIGLDRSLFVFYAGTHPDRAVEVNAEIDAEVARVKAGEVTEAELERCRVRLKAARPMGKQTIGARAMHAAIQSSYGLPLDDDAEHAAKLDAVDVPTLAAFANRHFDMGKRVALLVGPESLLPAGALD